MASLSSGGPGLENIPLGSGRTYRRPKIQGCGEEDRFLCMIGKQRKKSTRH